MICIPELSSCCDLVQSVSSNLGCFQVHFLVASVLRCYVLFIDQWSHIFPIHPSRIHEGLCTFSHLADIVISMAWTSVSLITKSLPLGSRIIDTMFTTVLKISSFLEHRISDAFLDFCLKQVCIIVEFSIVKMLSKFILILPISVWNIFLSKFVFGKVILYLQETYIAKEVRFLNFALVISGVFSEPHKTMLSLFVDEFVMFLNISRRYLNELLSHYLILIVFSRPI